MLRAVIDTRSLVSYVLARGEIMRRVVAHWHSNRFVLISSPQTRGELAEVLSRPRIRSRSVVPLETLVQGMERYSWRSPGILDLRGASCDPKDDKFLACAVEGEAQYLVSSDRDLLDIRMFRNVAIVNPGQFLLSLDLYDNERSGNGSTFR